MKNFLPFDSLHIDRRVATPLQQQLYGQLRQMIEERMLSGGSRLPSSRSLATELGLSRNTVTAAYEQLATEGYVHVRRGALPAGEFAGTSLPQSCVDRLGGRAVFLGRALLQVAHVLQMLFDIQGELLLLPLGPFQFDLLLLRQGGRRLPQHPASDLRCHIAQRALPIEKVLRFAHQSLE